MYSIKSIFFQSNSDFKKFKVFQKLIISILYHLSKKCFIITDVLVACQSQSEEIAKSILFLVIFNFYLFMKIYILSLNKSLGLILLIIY